MAKQTNNERHWYVVHTYSGYEDAVARNLKQRISSMGMEDYIFDVIVPKEKHIRIKNGKKVEEEDKMYKGYVLVDMIVTDESWYVVRNTPRVTGFVGAGNQPVPISDKELEQIMNRMNKDTAKHVVDLSVGDAVVITDGPFKDLEGKIGEIDEERGKAKVLVPMFGRETPVELDFVQIKQV